MRECLTQSATKLAAAIRRGDLSSGELLEATIARTEKLHRALNAVITTCFDEAKEQAARLDDLTSRGVSIGPLHGVPMTIKDSLDTAGIRSTGGTLGREHHIPTADAPVVKRLRDAGAIVVGKTNTPELTLSGETNNLIFGRTNNPYDLSRSPGGSSGGSVAAVATGCSALDLGSDTGGSVREPAHYCGVVGLKPTFGRSPRSGHIVPYAMGALDCLTQVGPITRYVDDAALVYQLISGPDFSDPSVVPAPVLDPEQVALASLNVAFYTDNGVSAPSSDIAEVVNNCASALRDEGADVSEQFPPALPDAARLYGELRRADGGTSTKRLLRRWGTEQHAPDLNYCLELPPAIPGEQFSALLEAVDTVKSQMLSFMQAVDLIVCPPATRVAFLHGDSVNDTLEDWSHNTVYNLTGWPSIVVRAGTSETGLPIGVQLVAKPWREDIALAAAKVIERTFGGYKQPDL